MSVKGILQEVGEFQNDHPKYGISYRLVLTVDGEKYSAFVKQSAKKLGLVKGKLVTFSTETKGDYENWLPKTLQISEPAESDLPADDATDEAPAAKPAAKKTPWAGEKGVKIGHAINNAVLITNAAGAAGSLKAIHAAACDILALSVVLEGQYDRIIESAAERVKAKTGAPATAETPEPEQEVPPAPAPKPKAAAAKPAAKPAAAKPKPVQAPDPNPDATDAGWDDAIPF